MTTDIASTGGALTVDEMKADLTLEQLDSSSASSSTTPTPTPSR